MVLTELITRKKSKKQNEAVIKKRFICTKISGQKPDMNQTITNLVLKSECLSVVS